MTSVTFHGGVGVVGGNKILLKDGGTQVFLDFGKNFGREKEYYDDPYLSPREDKHLLELGLLPDIEGIYKDESPPTVDGVLITHPHLDHWGYTCFLDNDIPLFCGETTRDIILNYEFATGIGPKKKYNLANMTKSSGREINKDFRTFRTGDRLNMDDLEIEPVHVDHSVPGAYGYIIHTTSGTLAYTGDLRFHGPESQMTMDFIDRASEKDIDVMVSEGTNMTGAHRSSEQEVKRKLGHLISRATGLVIISSSQRDVDRLRSIYKAARKNGRKIALSKKQAFYLLSLEDDEHLDIFEISDEDVLVFGREKSRTSAWEEEVEMRTDIARPADIRSMQEDVVLLASYYDMNQLLKVDPGPGSIFILSQSEPFDEEGEIQHEKLKNWCSHHGLPIYHIHASGHAMPHQLKEAIRRVGPDTLIPVHTPAPELFARYVSDLDVDVKVPELSETIMI